MFFISGFPALIYQLVWQRVLFTLYGVNIESVTVVVAAFMLGLGLGSLLGGWLSTSSKLAPLLLFAAIEAGIGACGLVSLELFAAVGRVTLHVSTVGTGLITFAMVLVPTLLMGATLPILTGYLVRHIRNVGRTVGLLYFTNTIGSAVSCFVTGGVLLDRLGQHGCVQLAACVNFAVAGAALLLWQLKRQQLDAEVTIATEASASTAVAQRPARGRLVLSMILAGLCGFVSLGYELLWYRAHSMATAGAAWTFAFMLGAYLCGIAGGSLLARKLCADESAQRDLGSLSQFVLLASVCGYAVVPISGLLVTRLPYAALLPLVALAAALLGAQLPLICHFGLKPVDGVGEDFSRVYLANILGSTAGSLITGFVLLDAVGLSGASLLLSLLGCGMAASLAWVGRAPAGLRTRITALAVTAAALTLALHGRAYDGLFERLQLKNEFTAARRFSDVVESRSGVVTIMDDNVIFGGGIYDGRFNVLPIDDQNTITRIYALSLFHPAPARVLGIGLSGGSWSQVIAHHPQLESLRMVEINPSYLDLIRKHGVVSSLLHNPKVHITIDDGRRYLARSAERYDAVVSNTTYHWRASSSNLLSVEFLQLVRAHLNPGGVLMYNTTGASEVFHTACRVFPHVVRVFNFVVASDRPFPIDKRRWRTVLEHYAIDGKPVFDLNDAAHRGRLDEIVSSADGLALADGEDAFMEAGASLCRRVASERSITDDNMGTEWEDSVARAFITGCQDGGSCTP